MRYLLWEYGESPVLKTEMPKVKYNYEKNLNILETNNKPAIESLEMNLATETSTKVHNEVPDSDKDFQIHCVTQTLTLVSQEGSDTDADTGRYSLEVSLTTMTTTREELESTDHD